MTHGDRSREFLAFKQRMGQSVTTWMQHFMLDVCVGSIIGFVTPCLYFFFARNTIIKLSNRLCRTNS